MLVTLLQHKIKSKSKITVSSEIWHQSPWHYSCNWIRSLSHVLKVSSFSVMWFSWCNSDSSFPSFDALQERQTKIHCFNRINCLVRTIKVRKYTFQAIMFLLFLRLSCCLTDPTFLSLDAIHCSDHRLCNPSWSISLITSITHKPTRKFANFL